MPIVICPRCRQPMPEVDPGDGATGRLRTWTCEADRVVAEARHPVQLVHIAVGQEDEQGGVRRRVIAKEIVGAELIVFHETLID